jgi:WD40 repeat protein
MATCHYLAWRCSDGTGDGNAVYIWSALDRHPSPATPGAFRHCHVYCVECRQNQKQGSLFVWDVQSGACIFAHENQGESISAIAWGASEDELISGDSKGLLSWWDIPSGTCVRVREAHQGKIQALKRSLDGCRLASCGDDGAIMLWLHQSLRRGGWILEHLSADLAWDSTPCDAEICPEHGPNWAR